MVAGMNCFPCFTCQKSKKSLSTREHGTAPQENVIAKPPDMKKQRPEEANQVDAANINAKHFTFREIATATKNFRQECLLGEGGFGRVYKGIIPATGQVVAVKQLDRHGMHGSKEFLSEVHTLSLVHHENLVNLIGYCADGDQRLLVYEFIQGATLEDRLIGSKGDQPPLDWYTRMKVAAGAARGLEYLHDSANPPIIYRDLKPSDILLDSDNNAKLFDFGLGQPGGDKVNLAPPRVMGTYGYCAPEYVRTGQLTLKSDVYSFGVVLLELITGRRAVDTTRPNEEQNLVSWAQPLFRDPKRYPDMADPHLNKNFPEKDLNQAVAIAAMCLQEEAEARPLMSDVVTALSFLSVVPPPAPLPHAISVSKKSAAGQGQSGSESESESESESGSESECESQSGSESSYSRSSHKSSTRSRNGRLSSDSESGSFSSSYRSSSSKHHGGELSQKKTSRKSSTRELSQKSSKKTSANKDLSQKSSKKSSANKDLSQKSSRKTSIRDLSHKSSRKSSVRVLSHKSSMVSDDGSVSMNRNSSSVASEDLFEHSGSRMSRGNISFGLISSGSVNSSRMSGEDGSMSSSMRSDEGSGRPFDRGSSSGSDEGSVHSR